MHAPLANPELTRLRPAPKHFAREERQLWNELVTTFVLDDCGSLELLQSAMEARARARRCRESIDAEGEAVRDFRGTLKAHPLIAAEKSARSAYVQLMRLLRLKV
jgi:hypothetical protein